MHSPAPPASVPAAAAPDAARGARLRRLLQRAESYRAAGQHDAALASLEAAVQADPDSVAARLALSDLHLAAGRHNPARAATLEAINGHLESPRVALDLLRSLNGLTESGLMVEIARQLPPPMWDSARSLAEIAQEMTLIGAHDLAREYTRAAVARDPHHAPSLVLQATLDVFYGDLDSAAAHATRCLELLPADPASHWLLSRLRLPGGEARVARIERILAQGVSADDAAWLGYALHNELHDLRQYERAWAALERACAAKRATLRYDRTAAHAPFEALRAWTREEALRPDGCDDPRLTPIFVIGLHRSGTTLAERILSGHSAVQAGGETYDLRAQLRRASGLHFGGEAEPQVIARRADYDYRALGEGYLRGIAWRGAGRPFVTDKLPSNYYNVGFIARALPRARFIHLRRDAVDVGLSSLRTLFSHACPYSYDPLDYVAHHRDYTRLMEHWRQVVPERILDVDYEDLVNAPEATAERMARFCGLEYEPGMVRIESRSEAVATASSVMMRDGIRKDRGQVWKAYEAQLQPMIRALQEG